MADDLGSDEERQDLDVEAEPSGTRRVFSRLLQGCACPSETVHSLQEAMKSQQWMRQSQAPLAGEGKNIPVLDQA